MLIWNYVKTGWRNIKRFKLFSIINITGLSIALACAIILFLYAENELSFDDFHSKKDNIFRIVYVKESPNATTKAGYSPYPLTDLLRLQLPAYTYTRLMNYSRLDFKVGEQVYAEENILFVDSLFFQVFDYKWLKGNQEQSLSNPKSVVLTESIAMKYFKDEDPLGKLIEIPGYTKVSVSGVVEDSPENNSQPFNIIAPLGLFSDELTNLNYLQWGVTLSGMENWILLPNAVKPDDVESQISDVIKEHAPEGTQKYLRYDLQALDDVHLSPEYVNNSGTYATSKSNILMVAVIGLLILLIGSINFINLSNAQGMRRMKEVGVRKVLGAARSTVRNQFLAETYLMALVSVIIALILVEIFIPYVNLFMGNLIELSIYQSPNILFFIIALFLLIGFVSGFYPSVFISGFNPLETLEGNSRNSGKWSVILKNMLLLIQFVISVGLLIVVFVINSQMEYIRNKDLGFKKDDIVVFSVPDPNEENIDQVRNLLNTNPNISSYTMGFGAPTSGNNMGSSYSSPETDMDDDLIVNLKFADSSYFETFGLELIAGNWRLGKTSADTVYRFVVNEKLVYSMGVTNARDAVGMKIQISGIRGRIEGVVKDFHIASLKNKKMPVVFINMSKYFYEVMVHVSHNLNETINEVNDGLSGIFPDYFIDYYTVEEKISSFYERDQKTLTLLKLFSGIALVIALMGLFGLVSFYMVQRTREIGIRKILGASSGSIFLLLVRWQMILLMIATLVGGLLGWYFSNKWLQEYNYRIDYPYWVFWVVFLIMVILNFLTILYHVFKTTRANPVDAIKYE